MADWPPAFSSATTSLPRLDCGSASENWRRLICGLLRTAALTQITLRAKHDGPKRPCAGPGRSGIDGGPRTGPTIPFLTTDNDIRWGIPAKSIEPLASLSNKRCDGLSVAEVLKETAAKRYPSDDMPQPALPPCPLRQRPNMTSIGPPIF